MTDQSAMFVGSIPEHYDEFLGPRLFNRYATDLARRVAAVNPAAVLELAAGTGIASRCLRDVLAPECTLLVSDLNSPMLELAGNKFQPNENVSFAAVDASSLPCDDASIDVVACQFGVMFFPDKPRSYRQVLRVLRPAGKYIFNVWGTWGQNRFAQIAHTAVEKFYPDNPPGFYHVPFSYNDAQEIEKALLDAGFASVSIQSLAFTSPVAPLSDFARGLVFGNPLYDEVLQRGGDPEQICLAVGAALEKNMGANTALEALVVEAVKG